MSRIILLTLSTLCLTALGAGAAQCLRPAGVVVEQVAPGSAGGQAGLQPGDELTAWSSASGDSGILQTPFDFGSVEIEQAPRGMVTFRGCQGGEEKTWYVPLGDWRIEARPVLEPDLLALYEKGRERIASGDLDAGAALWRSALEALERQGVPQSISWLENRLARAFAAAGKWHEADAAWERAERRLDVRSASDSAQILDEWGKSLDQRGAYDRAEECFHRALRMEPEASLAAARELNALGTLARQRDDLSAAESFLHQARSIRERLAPGSLELASTINELGVLAAIRGEMAVAEESFSKALELQQRLAPDDVEAAGTLINLGNISQYRGDFATAEERFRSAVDLIEGRRPDNQELARALTRLGDVEMDRGELAIAEEHFRQALEIRQKLAPETLDVAGSIQILGLVAARRGDFAAAEEHHRRALEIREKLTPGSGAVAESLANLGSIERRMGDLAKADELYRRALEIQERTRPGSLGATEMRNERAVVASERGDLALAEELYGRVLSEWGKSSPESLQVADAQKGLGVVAYKRGDLQKAENLLRRALATYEKLVPGSSSLGTLLNDLGQVYRRAGRAAQAAELFCRATEVFDQQRKKLGGTTEGRSAFGGTTAEHYRDCLAALVEIGRPEEAFRSMERGRARSFLDLLAERDLRWPADLPPELVRARKLADAEYDRTQAALSRLSPTLAETEVHRLQVRLRELRARQEEIIEKVRQVSPRNATLHHPQPLDLATARKTLDPGTLLVAYSIGRDRSFLFVVEAAGTAGPGLEVFPLSLGDQALRQRVESFRNLLQRADSERTAFAEQGRELYDLLLRPADSRIATAARILISPDGPLHTLPFAALVRQGHFLAEQKPLHTVISTTVYAELKKSRAERPASPRMEIAAFGDPSYPQLLSDQSSTIHPETRAEIARGLKLTPLPATRDEVLGITALYPKARAFLGSEATEEHAKSIGTGTFYIHFACHGLFDERFPLNSSLALSIPSHPGEGGDNGLLQAWEIFDEMRLDADLVTLSACDSAMGPEMGGEGLLGLTRAFQYAGARTVLASLWSVSDLSTADLMKRFYGYLRAGKAKDEALQAAQADLIQSPSFSHPYHWAAFQLSGDWR